jgi:hypothetical protein
VAAAQSPIYLVILQMAAVAFLVLAAVGALALHRRSFELAVLKSRGCTRRQLLAAQGVEAMLTASLAFPLGLGIGWLLAVFARSAHGPYVAGTLFPIRLTASALDVGAVGAAVGALLLTAISLPQVSRSVIEERRRASREDRPITSRFPVEIVLAALGIAAFWEVRKRGLGPSVGGRAIDPFALLAPTLLLAAAAFVALRLLLLAFRWLDGPVGRIRATWLYLAGRRVGRAAAASSATALLLLLATGLLVISSSIRTSVVTAYALSAHSRVGAEWSYQVNRPPQGLFALAHLPPRSTGLVRTTGLTTSSGAAVDVVGLDASTYRTGAWPGDVEPSVADRLEGLRPPQLGVALPARTDHLVLDVTATRPPPGLVVSAVVERSDGRTVTVGLGNVGDGEATLQGATPPGPGRLLSMAFELPAVSFQHAPLHLSLGLSATANGRTTPIDLTSWTPMRYRNSGGQVSAEGAGRIRASLFAGIGTVAEGLTAPILAVPAFGTPNPVAAPDGFSVVVDGLEIPVDIRGGVPDVAGLRFGTRPVLILPERSLMALTQSVPGADGLLSEVRSMAAADPAPAFAADGLRPTGARSAVAIEASLALDPQSLAIGLQYAAALAGIALVVIGVSAGLYFGQRRREFEFAALRAMGAGRRELVGALAAEQGLLIAFALAVAVGVAAWLLRIMAPYVAPSVTTAVTLPGLRIDVPTLMVLITVTLGASAIGFALAARDLLRTSITSTLRGEVE